MLSEARWNGATNLQRGKALKAWQGARGSRYRWNVLDLLNRFGKKAVTCYLFSDIDLAQVEKLRKHFADEGHSVTVTAFLIKAIGLAQRRHPASRTMCLPGSRLVTYNNIVAGFTVEKEVEGQPIVFFGEIEGPDKKSLLEIAGALKDYADSDIVNLPKLREQMMFAQMPWLVRQLLLSLATWFPSFRLKFMGATFGLSSLGALGVGAVAGPSVCTSVFGVGAVSERAVVRNGEIVARPMLTLSLNFDHRVMDVWQAARFLKEIREYLEGDLLDCME